MLNDKYKNIILEICDRHLSNYELFLFGSRARNDEDSRSDIDLAIKTKEKNKDYKLALINEEFKESIIPYKIDCLDYDLVDTALAESISKQGVKLNAKTGL